MTRNPLLPLTAVLCMSGCVVDKAGPVEYSSRTIERDNSEAVRVDLEMGAGRLRVGSGTDKLMRADFAYSVPVWKPEVRYSSTAGRATLSIKQPSHRASIGNVKYEWDVRLNREVPMNVNVNFGAGDAELDLSAITLRGVDVEMGVGKLELDLRGTPKSDYNVRIRGGVGECVVYLPRHVGVLAEAEGGIGEITASDLRHQGQRYFNDEYQKSKVTVRLDIQGGIGAIRLVGGD